jgi:hypothetical protein
MSAPPDGQLWIQLCPSCGGPWYEHCGSCSPEEFWALGCHRPHYDGDPVSSALMLPILLGVSRYGCRN